MAVQSLGSATNSIVIAIDRGGTFTDVWASVQGQPDYVFKLLSVDPDHYKDAPTEGMLRHCLASLFPGSVSYRS